MFERAKTILQKYVDEVPIETTLTLEGDLGLSSFDVVEIVTEFEEAFGIEIPDRDISRFVCVKDIVEYLKERV